MKGKGKKVAAAPLVTKKPAPPKKVQNPLFEKRPRNFGIGMFFLDRMANKVVMVNQYFINIDFNVDK